MAWEWMESTASGLKNLIQGVSGSGYNPYQTSLGMDKEKIDAHMQEWYDYAKNPADKGEISSQEYHRRGGELLSKDVRGGWHGKVPLGQFALPALSAVYQLGQEGLRGLLGHQSYNKRGVGPLGNIGEMGLGLIGGAKDAIENIKGMARAGQFDERFYRDKQVGSTFRTDQDQDQDDAYTLNRSIQKAPERKTVKQTTVSPLRASRRAAGRAQRQAKTEFGVKSPEYRKAVGVTKAAAEALRGSKK